MSEEVVVVVAGGVEPPRRKTSHAVRAGTTVIAADGGLERARELGLQVTIAVGDFDSASPETVRAAETWSSLSTRLSSLARRESSSSPS